MKTNKLFKNIVWGMTLCGALCTTSCTSFDELNTDPTRMDEVNPGTLLNPILYETSVYNWKRYNSYTYDLMQCAVSTSSTNGVGWCLEQIYLGNRIYIFCQQEQNSDISR